MSLLARLNPFRESINKGLDILDQRVEDRDLVNKIRADLAAMDHEAYLAELAVKTVPWVDGLDKMGRQIHGYLVLGIVGGAILAGTEVDPALAAVMAAPGTVYTWMKGKGA